MRGERETRHGIVTTRMHPVLSQLGTANRYDALLYPRLHRTISPINHNKPPQNHQSHQRPLMGGSSSSDT
jgi:hypothetical protein